MILSCITIHPPEEFEGLVAEVAKTLESTSALAILVGRNKSLRDAVTAQHARTKMTSQFRAELL
jgi:hypothetical protein